MQFWNVNNLSDSLIKDELSEKEKSRYYLALLYLQLVSNAIPAYIWGSRIDGLGLLSYLVAAIVGTYSIISIFTVNEKIDGKNFIERITVLGFPAFVKSTVVYWLLYCIFTIAYATTESMTVFQIFVFFGLPFYLWFGFEQIRKALLRSEV